MQQVNLLECLPVTKQILSAKHLFLIVLLVFLILTSLSLWQWGQLSLQYNALELENKKAQAIETSIQTLSIENPEVAKHKSLKRTVALLSKRLFDEKMKFEQLSQRLLKSGFSLYLHLLAKHVTPAVELDTIFISHVKENIALYGQAHSAKDVSHMVSRLYLSPLLKGIVFTQYVIARKKQHIKFEVATKKLVNQNAILNTTFMQGKIQQKLLLGVKK